MPSRQSKPLKIRSGLEFLGLKDEYSETELEEGLVQHLTDFLLESGDDFTFLGRQKRLRIDATRFRIDLLFFHRRLHCLVVIDLKVGRSATQTWTDAPLSELCARTLDERGREPSGWSDSLCREGTAEAHYALENLPNEVLGAGYQMVLPDEKMIAKELRKSRRKLTSQSGDLFRSHEPDS